MHVLASSRMNGSLFAVCYEGNGWYSTAVVTENDEGLARLKTIEIYDDFWAAYYAAYGEDYDDG